MKRESIIPYNVVIKAAASPGPMAEGSSKLLSISISPNNVPNIPKAGAAPPIARRTSTTTICLKKFSWI
jgi:hypothetical protein